jgi:PQQ-dependent catabolism-associated beta-propeller protein
VIKQIAVGVEPEGIAVSGDGKWVVNTSETSNMVHWIDPVDQSIKANTLVDPRPRAAEFSANSDALYVSSEIGGSLSRINVASKQVDAKVHFTIPGVEKALIQPVGVLAHPNNKLLFVALGPANRVAVVDTQTMTVTKYLLVGQRVWNLAFSPDLKRLYTTNGVSNDISIIDIDNLKVTKSIRVGHYPWGIAVKK